MVEGLSSPTQNAGCFKDARDKPITLLDPYALHLMRRHDVIPAEPLSEIAREVGSAWEPKWARHLTIAGLCMVIVSFGVACLINWYRGGPLFDPVGRILWPILFVWCFAIACFVWGRIRQTRLRRTWKVMLKYLRCPHCGYDIRGLPTDPSDGATVCPECGCAWKLGDSADAQNGGHDGRR